MMTSTSYPIDGKSSLIDWKSSPEKWLASPYLALPHMNMYSRCCEGGNYDETNMESVVAGAFGTARLDWNPHFPKLSYLRAIVGSAFI